MVRSARSASPAVPACACPPSTAPWALLRSASLGVGSVSARDGTGLLGVARTAATAAGSHRSSTGILCIVLTRIASPLGSTMTCSPVRGNIPTHVPLTLLSASFLFPFFTFLSVLGFLSANLPITCSPNSATTPFHVRPVSLLQGVRPSWPTWYLVNTKAACRTSQRTIGSCRSSRSLSRASSASTSLRIMPTTSWTAFSAPPFDCGLYGGEFRSSVCISGRALATARWRAVIAGSPSDIRQRFVRPQSARSLVSCLTTQASPGPLVSQS